LAAPDARTEPLLVRVSPKHTDHEFAPTPESEHDQIPASLPDGFHRATAAETE